MIVLVSILSTVVFLKFEMNERTQVGTEIICVVPNYSLPLVFTVN